VNVGGCRIELQHAAGDAELFDLGTCALHRTAEADGVFCYTFKGVGQRP
jgi:hypothetical protein